MMPSVVILAGGVAKRLRPITETIPKAMLTVAGEPFVAHQLRLLQKNGIRKAVICSGYLSRQIEDFVGNGSQFGLSVTFSIDGEKLLGTGGALKKALPLLGEDFFVMYGDSYLTVDLKRVYEYFLTQSSLGLMTVIKNCNAWDNSNIVFAGGRIIAYDKKRNIPKMDYIDYGLGILKKAAFVGMGQREIFDLSELYQGLITQKQICGYEVIQRFYEIGSMSGLKETEAYLLNINKQEQDHG